MKNGIFGNILHIVLFAFLALLILSCKRTATPESVRIGNDRAITIINNTGNQIAGYQVNVAGSGVEIERGTPSTNGSFAIKISDSFKNDPEIEVVLVDIFERIYAKTFNVQVKGNTDTPITAEDRRYEGGLKDAWKDLTAWLNRNK